MTDTATELPEGLDFDFSELTAESVESVPGPLGQSRTGRGTGKPGGTRRRRSAGSKRLEALQAKLSSEMFQAGTLTGLALPVTGYYICQESDAFTKAVLQLAARRPEWLEALEHVADVGPGLVVGRTALGIGASFAVDRGRVDPDKKALMFLGVYTAYQAVHGDKPKMEEGSAYTEPPSGAFVPVA